MLQKLRRVMGESDDKYKTEGLIEVDEAMITVHPGEQGKTKRGRGSEGKSIVLVLAQAKYNKNKKNEDVKVCQYVKMKCVNSFGAVDLQTQVVLSVKPRMRIGIRCEELSPKIASALARFLYRLSRITQ